MKFEDLTPDHTQSVLCAPRDSGDETALQNRDDSPFLRPATTWKTGGGRGAERFSMSRKRAIQHE